MVGKDAVTIKDVSERAGVAISTVSRVLNGLDRVSDETRERVRQAADELGYVRNSLAASVKTGLSRLIVVIVPDIINEYYTSVIQGVEEVAVSNGYYPVVFSSKDSHNKENELFSGELGHILDGAIIIPAINDLSYYKGLDKPVVVVDRYVSGSEMPAVVIDNHRGGYLATQELIQAGHRDIAVISGAEEFNIGIDRLAGYTDALRDHGLPPRREYIRTGSWYQDFGYDCTMALLALDRPPTAIFAANNLLCIGCLQALRRRGLAVGRDISLVGLDDSAVAELAEPGITVVKRATTEMGRLGMEKLIDLIEQRKEPRHPRKIVLDVGLVRRRSVAPPPTGTGT